MVTATHIKTSGWSPAACLQVLCNRLQSSLLGHSAFLERGQVSIYVYCLFSPALYLTSTPWHALIYSSQGFFSDAHRFDF